MYIQTKAKMQIAVMLGLAWIGIAYMILLPWTNSLIEITGMPVLCWTLVFFLAFVPGFSNVFVIAGLLMDKRPQYNIPDELPDVSILVAAYNEETAVSETFESIIAQEYPGKVNVFLVDDGSTDRTYENAQAWIELTDYDEDKFEFKIIELAENKGKALALNAGLERVTDEYIVTIDADTYLYKDALAHLVTNIVEGPENTAAVAGVPLVRNSRKNWLTKIQEWDYFHMIYVTKRVQSLFQGTLVAQGAFSVYSRAALLEIGGWEDLVGEDIVLTWAFREKGYRVGFSEVAIAFTHVPDNYKQYFRQRKRWARGLIEAFKAYPKTITNLQMNTPFIWINVCIPFVDMAYFFVFVPGALAAIFFNVTTIVGIYVLIMVPVTFLINWIYFSQQRKIFNSLGLKVRKNSIGLLVYMLFYQVIVSPAVIAGYFSEFFKTKKTWGTK